MLENKSADFADIVKPQQIEDTKKIGNFIIGKIIILNCLGKTKGKGTFGKVKSGTHEPTGEKVRLKL
jgi:hypothetical protein